MTVRALVGSTLLLSPTSDHARCHRPVAANLGFLVSGAHCFLWFGIYSMITDMNPQLLEFVEIVQPISV